MTRIAHLSDLHFGLHRPELVGPLLDRVNTSRVDLVVVTGDLTHRGRPGQFRQAREFLSRLQPPVIAMPGNHDVPLFNIPLRFLRPWTGYRAAIDTRLAPVVQAGQARVLSINSADPLAWQRGVLRPGEIPRVLGGLDPLSVNIVALHHPLQHLPQVDKRLARGALEARRRFEAAGVRIALSGHLHRWAAVELLEMGHPGLLQVQAGTALCARESDRQNEFAVLDLGDDDLTIERHICPMPRTAFEPPRMLRLVWRDGGWRRHEPGAVSR